MREERRRVRRITTIDLAKFRRDFSLLPVCEPHIHYYQDGEHEQGQQGRPLKQEPDHNKDEAHVLPVAQVGRGASGGERLRPLRLVEHIPGGGKQSVFIAFLPLGVVPDSDGLIRHVHHAPLAS